MEEITELLKLAAELKNYADTMPTDPFARRWRIISKALIAQANGMAG